MNNTSVFKIVAKYFDSGWIIIMYTDKFLIDYWPFNKEIEEDKVLEIRVFNKEKEYLLSRKDVGSAFKEKIVDDNEMKKESDCDFFDEVQILDIDDTKGFDSDGKVTSTGGGKYFLPLKNKNDAKVRIRYYICKSDSSGQAVIKDWRVVEFIEGGE